MTRPAALILAICLCFATTAATYISTGEGQTTDPLPNAFKLSGNADLQGTTLREGGFASPASANRSRLPEGEAHDPVDPVAWAKLADIAKGRGMPLTIEGENSNFSYSLALWLSNEAECRRRIGLVATALAVCKARQPTVPLYVEAATPAQLGMSGNDARFKKSAYDALCDYEAQQLGGLVAGPTVQKYFAEWNTLAQFDAECDFYLAAAAGRYKGTPRLILSPKKWNGGDEKGYVGDAAMDHMVAFAALRGCDVEIWGAANASQKAVPEFWDWLRRGTGKRLTGGG
jgi:hypothetical protein